MKPLLIGVFLFALMAGCGGDEGFSGSPPRDCVDEWNAPGNAENRAVVSDDGDYGAAAVGVVYVNHAAEGLSGEGCTFLFHDDSRFISVDGMWDDGASLRWGPWLRGSWSEEQQDGTQDNAAVRDDGALEGR